MKVTQANVAMLICIVLIGIAYHLNQPSWMISSLLVISVILVFADRLERQYIYKEIAGK